MASLLQRPGGRERLGDGDDDALPALLLDFEPPPPGRGQPIELGPAVVLGFAPLRFQKTMFLEAVERRKQRAGLDLKGPLSDLLDAPGDAQTVIPAQGDRLQDQQIESPLQQLSPFLVHNSSYRVSIRG